LGIWTGGRLVHAFKLPEFRTGCELKNLWVILIGLMRFRAPPKISFANDRQNIRMTR
jgi:hypothetical protein